MFNANHANEYPDTEQIDQSINLKLLERTIPQIIESHILGGNPLAVM